MKRFISLALIIALCCLACVGCSNKQEEISIEETTKTNTTIEDNYSKAEDFFAEKKYVDAIRSYELCGDYLDAKNKIEQAQKEIEFVKSHSSTFFFDNSIGYINRNYEFEYVGNSSALNEIHMQDLAEIVASYSYIIGLHKDGTVQVFGNVQSDWFKKLGIEPKSLDYIDTVSNWTNIQKIAMDENDIVAGLKSDGTVVYTINPDLDTLAYTPNMSACENWRNIKDIAVAKSYGIWGLTSDNTLLVSKDDYAGDYNNIAGISVSSFAAYIQRNKVHTRGIFTTSPDNTAENKNIVQCSVGNHIIGLLYDDGHIKVWTSDKYTSIDEIDNVVSISACNEIITAYQADGTLNIIGDVQFESPNNNVKVIRKNFFEEKTVEPITPSAKKEPKIGMTKEEVLNSTWGSPKKKNISEYAWGTEEQWVYDNYQYIYFKNGIVTSIQRSE